MAPANISLRFKFAPLQSSSSSTLNNTLITPGKPTSIACSKPSGANDSGEEGSKPRKLSEQSSWEVRDSEGKDYLYRLGAETDNINIAVGARAGIIDDVFIADFLGKDSDIVFDYRQKATRSFEHLQGDYYIAPTFLDKVGKLS